MLIDECHSFKELQENVSKITLSGMYTQDQAKQRRYMVVKDFLCEHGITADSAIDHLSDVAQELQDFSVFEVVETLREYNECSNSH